MINKILAIQNCGPSGTTLLQSLLDGHSKILSLPALHGQELLLFWERYIGLANQDIFDRFMVDCAHFYDPSKMNNALGLMDMGVNGDEVACIDKELFEKYLREEWNFTQPITRKKFLVGVYRAYNRALGRVPSNDDYILYPIHCLPKKYAEWLVEDFSQVKFLHSVREPIQSIGSLAKHINKNPTWDILPLLSCVTAQMLQDYTLHVGFRRAHGMTPYFRDSANSAVISRAIKLEDIHKDSFKTLKKVCDWLEIPWEDSLLTSTFNGKLWNNRPESIRQKGIGTATLSQQHEDILSAFDKSRLTALSVSFMQYYGYQENSTFKRWYASLWLLSSLFLPFKMEIMGKRIKKQFQYLRMHKSSKKIIRRIPNLFDWPLIVLMNVYEYGKCRKKWLIPAWMQLKSSTQRDFVPLL